MFKFIFWTLIVFLLIRWLLRPYLKVMVYHTAKKMADAQFKEQQHTGRKKSPEGSIHIDYIPPAKNESKGGSVKGGDYVDFEEVK